MKKILMFFSLLLLTGSLAMAQTVNISGTVKSSEDGMTIPGVNVTAKGTTIGAITGINGEYTLTVPVSVKTKIDVVLQADLTAIDEVVVIAYGTAKKGSFTGATAMIDGKALEVRPVTNISKAIEGTNPGIQVTSASG
jgi:aconitase B